MNPVKVGTYFDTLQDVITTNNFTANTIYNCHETGLTEVHKPPNVIAAKGKKGVHAVTNGEKGTTTTVLCCASAAGHYIPPLVIFKGIRYNALLERSAPPGTIVKMSKSEW